MPKLLTKQTLTASADAKSLADVTVYPWNISNVPKYTATANGDNYRLANKIKLQNIQVALSAANKTSAPLTFCVAVVQPKNENVIKPYSAATGTSYLPNFFEAAGGTIPFAGFTGAGSQTGMTGLQGCFLSYEMIDRERYTVYAQKSIDIGPGAAGTNVSADAGVEGFTSTLSLNEVYPANTTLNFDNEWNATDDSSQSCANPIYLLVWVSNPRASTKTSATADQITLNMRTIVHWQDVL